ncbi:uroporphyrinogen decarboxylase family protein [Treponema sp.]
MIAEPSEVYYRKPDLYLEGMKRITSRFDLDMIFGPFALALEAEAYGAELDLSNHQAPTVKKPAFANCKAPDQIQTVESSPSLKYLQDSVQKLSVFFAERAPIIALITAPTDLPALLLGMENWLELLLFDEAEALSWMHFAEAHFIALAKVYFDAGAQFIGVPVMFANPAILTKKLIKDLSYPSLQRSFSSVTGPLLFHHGANPLEHHLELFVNLPSVAAFILDEKDDLNKARAFLGPEAILISGPSGPSLVHRKPELIRRSLKRIQDVWKENPRTILATTDADISWDTGEEAIDLLFQIGSI